ncbi:unnamed protein product [Parajaminaea phylloscopi]
MRVSTTALAACAVLGAVATAAPAVQKRDFISDLTDLVQSYKDNNEASLDAAVQQLEATTDAYLSQIAAFLHVSAIASDLTLPTSVSLPVTLPTSLPLDLPSAIVVDVTSALKLDVPTLPTALPPMPTLPAELPALPLGL